MVSGLVWTLVIGVVAFVAYLITQHDDRSSHNWRGIHVVHWILMILAAPISLTLMAVGTSSPRPKRTDRYRDGSGLGNPSDWGA